MSLFTKVTRTVDSIVAPFQKLIDELEAHHAAKHAEIAASKAEIDRHRDLIGAAQVEADRAKTVAERFRSAVS